LQSNMLLFISQQQLNTMYKNCEVIYSPCE
jgi:hypothetical protein